MRGGLQDYDDARYQNKTFRGEEYVPTAVVGDAPHDLHCAPGACGVYSSVGYLLLGLAAATAVNLSDWRALDQGALAFGGDPGQQKGDSTSIQHECSARARSKKSIHASRPFREMIARPKISQNEWKTAEI